MNIPLYQAIVLFTIMGLMVACVLKNALTIYNSDFSSRINRFVDSSEDEKSIQESFQERTAKRSKRSVESLHMPKRSNPFRIS